MVVFCGQEKISSGSYLQETNRDDKQTVRVSKKCGQVLSGRIRGLNAEYERDLSRKYLFCINFKFLIAILIS